MSTDLVSAMSAVTGLRLGDVVVGEALPQSALPLTLQRLVMEAGVNRDFTPTHHDTEMALASGAPGPYLNTPVIMALLEAGIRDWMGAEGRLLELDFRMLRFNVVGSVVRFGGEVVALHDLDPVEDGNLDPRLWGKVEVGCWISNGEEPTVVGSAQVALRRSTPDGAR
jgi:acyl dehydratase